MRLNIYLLIQDEPQKLETRKFKTSLRCFSKIQTVTKYITCMHECHARIHRKRKIDLWGNSFHTRLFFVHRFRSIVAHPIHRIPIAINRQHTICNVLYLLLFATLGIGDILKRKICLYIKTFPNTKFSLMEFFSDGNYI